MGQKRVDRREFLKLEAAAMAAVAGGMPAPVAAQNLITDRSFTELKWNKAPCRFCGTGCGVMSYYLTVKLQWAVTRLQALPLATNRFSFKIGACGAIEWG